MTEKMKQIEAGACVVCSDDVLDAMVENYSDWCTRLDVVSCLNRQRVGILDQYVAWARTKSTGPDDLAPIGDKLIGSPKAAKPKRLMFMGAEECYFKPGVIIDTAKDPK